MMKVIIKGIYKTTRGTMLTIDSAGIESLAVGDIIDAEGKKYSVLGIMMGSTPDSVGSVGLLVKETA